MVGIGPAIYNNPVGKEVVYILSFIYDTRNLCTCAIVNDEYKRIRSIPIDHLTLLSANTDFYHLKEHYISKDEDDMRWK